jgi:hypothetical protein
MFTPFHPCNNLQTKPMNPKIKSLRALGNLYQYLEKGVNPLSLRFELGYRYRQFCMRTLTTRQKKNPWNQTINAVYGSL